MAESAGSKKKRLQKAINMTEYQLDKSKEEFSGQDWKRVYMLAKTLVSPHLRDKSLEKDASAKEVGSLLVIADFCDAAGELESAELVEKILLAEGK